MAKAKSTSRKGASSSTAAAADNSATTHAFQAETRRVLDLMIHSLYSNKEIFLRELISNASDALDRLRFEAVRDAGLAAELGELAIEIESDPQAGTVTIRDNGIGMNREEITANLGTIARSGSRRFLEQLATEGGDLLDARLIGQFGVGFYSAFIVAEKITVRSLRVGEPVEKGVCWESAGNGEFTVADQRLERRGTSIELKLRPAEREFAQPWNLRRLVRQYSDFVSFPIRLARPSDNEGPGSEASAWEQVNRATALWALPKSEVSDEDYQEFYRHLSHDPEPALCWTHNRVEGAQSYTSLLFVPAKAPPDLAWQREERTGLRLYVNRVFIMDAAREVLPQYLRFIHGVIDSQDLPLNVSRELLQENELLVKIRAAVVRRSLDMLEKLRDERAAEYDRFWREFGPVIKEGVVEDHTNLARILGLLRFESTAASEPRVLTHLSAYVGRMKPGQDSIYFITADSAAAARCSPHLEIFRQHGVEVLLMSDRIDEWMMAYLSDFEGKRFRSVAQGEVDLSSFGSAKAEATQQQGGDLDSAVVDRVGAILGERVSAVRSSNRLTDSAACLVLPEHAMPIHLQRMLRQAGQDVPVETPALELNPAHALVRRVAECDAAEEFRALVEVLYGEALLTAGGELSNPAAFVSEINRLLAGTSSAT